jgi:anti-anti-sigma regulatory factor
MIVPVFVPPSRIDATNIAAFVRAVGEHVSCDRRMVIDCSEIVWISSAAMRVLEIASHDVPITLVNPSPVVHLMAAVFGGDVQCRYDGSSSPASEPEAARRFLRSVHTGEQVAS